MDLGNRLLMWWDRVRGYEQPSVRPANPPQRQPRPTGARALNQVNEGGAGGPLKLSVEGAPGRVEAPSGEPSDELQPREAGFNPYSSTGKYAKPHGWDDVPRK